MRKPSAEFKSELQTGDHKKIRTDAHEDKLIALKDQRIESKDGRIMEAVVTEIGRVIS